MESHVYSEMNLCIVKWNHIGRYGFYEPYKTLQNHSSAFGKENQSNWESESHEQLLIHSTDQVKTI